MSGEWSAKFYGGIMDKMMLYVPKDTKYLTVTVEDNDGNPSGVQIYTRSGSVNYGDAKHIKMDLTRDRTRHPLC